MANKGIVYTTGKVILYYPNLRKPYKYDEDSKEQYKVTLLIDKKNTKEISNLQNIIKKIWQEEGLAQSALNPLKNGDELAKEKEAEGKDGAVYKGYYVLRASSQFPVEVFTKDKLNWTGEDNEINGFYGRVNGVFKSYKSGINKGVKMYLRGTQVLEKSDLKLQSTIDCFEVEESTKDDSGLPFDDL